MDGGEKSWPNRSFVMKAVLPPPDESQCQSSGIREFRCSCTVTPTIADRSEGHLFFFSHFLIFLILFFSFFHFFIFFIFPSRGPSKNIAFSY